MNVIQSVKDQAGFNVFQNLIDIALMTGNVAGARSRVQEAREVLRPERVALLIADAQTEYGVTL
jgi:hypothetical protein